MEKTYIFHKCPYCEKLQYTKGKYVSYIKDKDNYFCKGCYTKHKEFRELIKGHEKTMEALGKL